MKPTARHYEAEASSDYSIGDCEDRAKAASDRQAEIWNCQESLSDLLCMLRGPLDYSATATDRQQGREAMELLQRAYRASTDHERRQACAELGKVIYHSLVDFVEEQARELSNG